MEAPRPINKKNRNSRFVFKTFDLICGLYICEIVRNSRYHLSWCYLIHWLIIVQKLDKLVHTYMKQTKNKSKIHVLSVHKKFAFDFKQVTP
jgi:hypothetical protein